MQRATHLLTESTKRSSAKSSTASGPTRATGATARTARQNRGSFSGLAFGVKELESTPTLQPGEKLIAIVPPKDDTVSDVVGRAFHHKQIGRAYTINESSVTVAVNEGKNLSKVSSELNGATVTQLKTYTPPDDPQPDEGNGNGSTENGENQNGKGKKPKDPFPAQGRVGGASARGGTPWGGGSVPSAGSSAAGGSASDSSSGGSGPNGGSIGGSAAGDGRSRDPVVADVKPSDVAKVGAGASLFWLLLA
jgi:hypothetical protein